MDILIDILTYSLFGMGIWDAFKYKIMSNKMLKYKSSKEHSRTFLNGSIIYRILLWLYAWLVLDDWVIKWTCVIALLTLGEAWYTMYITYPYKGRGLNNFKRPSMLKYAINSLLPNRIRKRL